MKIYDCTVTYNGQVIDPDDTYFDVTRLEEYLEEIDSFLKDIGFSINTIGFSLNDLDNLIDSI